MACGTRDVRVIDEDGDDCGIESVESFGDTGRWVIRDDDLLTCQAASE